jgi:hypothetical protein
MSGDHCEISSAVSAFGRFDVVTAIPCSSPQAPTGERVRMRARPTGASWRVRIPTTSCDDELSARSVGRATSGVPAKTTRIANLRSPLANMPAHGCIVETHPERGGGTGSLARGRGRYNTGTKTLRDVAATRVREQYCRSNLGLAIGHGT